MPIDETTPRLGLQKPAQPNTLRHDVERLRNSLDAIDEKVAVLADDPNNPGSKIIDPAVIPSNIARWDAAEVISSQHMPSDVPLMTKDATGKYRLAKDQLPIGSGTVVHNVASETLMTQIADAQVGDIAHIDNTLRAYLLAREPASSRNNWKALTAELPATIDTAGNNSDITSLTGLSGPLRLGGQGVNDYDAVTLGQLNAKAGGGGADMTGVMTNFLGSVEWFNGSRPAYPAGYQPADGQLVKRADYPELWAAIQSGMFASCTEDDWQKGKVGTVNGVVMNSTYINRGKYSTGDGVSTFRMPDLNGMVAGSASGLFLRGSGSGSLTSGTVAKSSLPNIVGSTGVSILSGNSVPALAQATGAIVPVPINASVSKLGPKDLAGGVGVTYMNPFSIDASRANGVYGYQEMYPVGSAGGTGIWAANEVRPPQAVGIWLIRVSAAVQAANTEYNVISSEAKEPAKGTTLHGGIIKSRLNVEGKTRVAAASYANFIWGSPGGTASHNVDVVAYNADGSIASNATYQFRGDGQLVIPRGNTGYANLWSGAAVKVQEWMATDGSESFQSLIAGSAATANKGYYGGVSFGMMTTGETAFPKAQISVAGTDRDASGNFSNVQSYRFSSSGDMETPYLKLMGVKGLSWANCGRENGLIWNQPLNVGSAFNFYSALTYRTSTPGGYQTTTHIGQIHGTASSFAAGVWGVWGDDDGKYNSRIQIGPNDGSISFVHADPSNPGGSTRTVAYEPGSDISLKRDVQDYDGQQSLDNIEAMELKTFIFKDDVQNRVRRGVIAQQVEQIDPLYVKTRTYQLGEGVERVQKELDSTALLLDALAAIKVLSARVAELEAKKK